MFCDQTAKLLKLYESYKKQQYKNEKDEFQERYIEKYSAECRCDIGPPDINVVFNRIYSFLKLPSIRDEADRLIEIIKNLAESKELGKVLGILKLDDYPALNLAIQLEFFDIVETLVTVSIDIGDDSVLFKPDPNGDTPLLLVLEKSVEELYSNSSDRKYYRIALEILNKIEDEAAVLTLSNNRTGAGVRISPLGQIGVICLLFPEERKRLGRFLKEKYPDTLPMQIYFCMTNKVKGASISRIRELLSLNFEEYSWEKELPVVRDYVICDRYGRNLLMYHVRFCPDRVESTLKEITKLDMELVKKILTCTTYRGSNALMIAARFYVVSVVPLLRVVRNFDQNSQTKIFSQTDRDGFTAYDLVKKYNPHYSEYFRSASGSKF